MAKSISLAKATKGQLVAELKRRIKMELREDEESRIDSELKALLTPTDGVRPAKRGKATGKKNPGKAANAKFLKDAREDNRHWKTDNDVRRSQVYKLAEARAKKEGWAHITYTDMAAQADAGAKVH